MVTLKSCMLWWVELRTAVTTLATSMLSASGRRRRSMPSSSSFILLPLVPEAVLQGVEGDVDDVVDVQHGAAGVLRAGHDLLAEDADDFQPGVVHLDEFADGGAVAEEVDLGAFAEHADGGAGGVVGLVEEVAFGEVQAVDDAVGGLDAVEFGDVAGGLGEHAGGVQGAARGERFEGLDVGFEDAHVALGESGRGAAALLEFLLAGGGAGFDEDVADAELLDEAQGLLAAPAPMASMPMTLPTPKTMPSAVSRVRVFCARRLAKAWPKSEMRIICGSAFMAPAGGGIAGL